MTYKQFLQLLSEVAASEGWRIQQGCIINDNDHCPIEAVYDNGFDSEEGECTLSYWEKGKSLGLQRKTMKRIISAADGRPEADKKTRIQLIKTCGIV